MMRAWLVDDEGIPAVGESDRAALRLTLPPLALCPIHREDRHALPACGRADKASPHQEQIVYDKEGQGDNQTVLDQPAGRHSSRAGHDRRRIAACDTR